MVREGSEGEEGGEEYVPETILNLEILLICISEIRPPDI